MIIDEKKLSISIKTTVGFGSAFPTEARNNSAVAQKHNKVPERISSPEFISSDKKVIRVGDVVINTEVSPKELMEKSHLQIEVGKDESLRIFVMDPTKKEEYIDIIYVPLEAKLVKIEKSARNNNECKDVLYITFSSSENPSIEFYRIAYSKKCFINRNLRIPVEICEEDDRKLFNRNRR